MTRSRSLDRSKGSSPMLREVDGFEDDVTESTRLLGDRGSEGDNERDLTRNSVSSGAWEGMKDFEDAPWWRKPSVFWLLLPYIVFTLAFGGVMVPKLNLILSMVCKQYFADRQLRDPSSPVVPVFLGEDNPQCIIPEVQSRVSEFLLVVTSMTGLLSAISAPKIGHLSDRYGRTRLMAIASCGGILNEILTVLAAKFPDVIDYRWLVLGAAFDGMTGSFTAGSILSQSYCSDCTPPSRRAMSIGWVHACLFSGLAVGPLLAAYLVKYTGSLLTIFYVVIGCHIFFMLFMGLVVPESVSKRRRDLAQERYRKEQQARVKTMGSWLSTIQRTNWFEPLRILWPQGPGTSTRLRVNLVALALSDVIILGSSMAAGAVIILYSREKFKWGTVESSFFISALSTVRVVTLLGVLPLVNYIFRVRPARKRREQGMVEPDKNRGAETLDIWVIRVALASEIVGCLGYFFAKDEKVFFGSGMMTALGGLGSATIQAVVTKHIPADRVGQLLGAIGMLHALTRVIGPIIFNGIYAATVGKFSQAFLVVLASLFVVAFGSSFVLKPHVHWDTPEGGEAEPLISEDATLRRLSMDGEPTIIT